MCNIDLRTFNPLLILLQILYKNSTYSLQIVKHIVSVVKNIVTIVECVVINRNVCCYGFIATSNPHCLKKLVGNK